MKNNVVYQQKHHAPYRCFVRPAQRPLPADSFPPSLRLFRASAWYRQGPAERPLIYSCDLNHTHKGMKAFRSVSAVRVCSRANGV